MYFKEIKGNLENYDLTQNFGWKCQQYLSFCAYNYSYIMYTNSASSFFKSTDDQITILDIYLYEGTKCLIWFIIAILDFIAASRHRKAVSVIACKFLGQTLKQYINEHYLFVCECIHYIYKIFTYSVTRGVNLIKPFCHKFTHFFVS